MTVCVPVCHLKQQKKKLKAKSGDRRGRSIKHGKYAKAAMKMKQEGSLPPTYIQEKEIDK